MSDPTIAFLQQPVQAIANEGVTFAKNVIDILNEWINSRHKEHVVQNIAEDVYILSRRSIRCNIVVIDRGDENIEVCVVSLSNPDVLASQFRALSHIDYLYSVMRVRLNKIDPYMFSAVAGTSVVTDFDDLFLPSNARGNADFEWLKSFNQTATRWASSKARNNFKSLLDDALFQPQIVERDSDELFVVSRRYFQEMVNPSSARELSRRYRGMALSDAGMPNLVSHTLPALESLPELGNL